MSTPSEPVAAMTAFERDGLAAWQASNRMRRDNPKPSQLVYFVDHILMGFPAESSLRHATRASPGDKIWVFLFLVLGCGLFCAMPVLVYRAWHRLWYGEWIEGDLKYAEEKARLAPQ